MAEPLSVEIHECRASIEALRVLIDERDRRYEVIYRAVESNANERDTRYGQRYDSQQLALKDAREAQDKAVAAALLAADRAVQKAEAAAESRFAGLNELRGAMADQANTLMPKAESKAIIDALELRLDVLEKNKERQAGVKAGGSEIWVLVSGSILGLIGLASLVIDLMHH